MATSKNKPRNHNNFEQLIISTNPERNFADENQDSLYAEDIKYWNVASALLGERTFTTPQYDVTISIQWKSIIRRLQHNHKIDTEVAEKIKKNEEVAWGSLPFITRPLRVRATVDIRPQKQARSPRCVHILQSFLYDVFLIMNIAAPGSCNFWRTKVFEPSETYAHEVSLSQRAFEIALLDGRKHGVLDIQFLELNEVVNWYFSIRNGFAQLPLSRMEKALFALMHISGADVSPATIIWIFYGLETFFGTRPGENRQALLKRVGLLLSPNPKQMASIKKGMDDLYNRRSSFVHGGMEVHHPAENDILDSRILETQRDLLPAADFGFSLLFRCIQEAVTRRWNEIHFDERMRGITINY